MSNDEQQMLISEFPGRAFKGGLWTKGKAQSLSGCLISLTLDILTFIQYLSEVVSSFVCLSDGTLHHYILSEPSTSPCPTIHILSEPWTRSVLSSCPVITHIVLTCQLRSPFLPVWWQQVVTLHILMFHLDFPIAVPTPQPARN